MADNKTATASPSPDGNKKLDAQQLIDQRLKDLANNGADDDENDGYVMVKIESAVVNRSQAFRKRMVHYNKKGHARHGYEKIGDTISNLALIAIAQLEAKRNLASSK